MKQALTHRRVGALIGLLLLASGVQASAPTVSVTLTGPDEGWYDDSLVFTASGQYSLDGPTQQEVADGEASVSDEYIWTYSPAELVAGGGAHDTSVTVRYSQQQAGQTYTVSVTYKVTVTYKDDTSDSASASASKDVFIKKLEINDGGGGGGGGSEICAGHVESPPHQKVLRARVTGRSGIGLSGKSVSFEVETTPSDYPATVSPAQATTDQDGYAETTLTSSRRIGATATVTATCEEKECELSPTVTMIAEDDAWDIVPQVLIADGESTADITVTLTSGGMPVDGHEIQWRISSVWDESGTLVYTAAPEWGSKTGYGEVSAGPATSDGDGCVSTVYTVGTNAGTIEFEALDYTDVYNSPYGMKNLGAYAKKIGVRRITTSGTEPIQYVGTTVYEANFDASGTYAVDIQHKPIAAPKASQFGIGLELTLHPSGSTISGIEWQYTCNVLATDGTPKEGGGSGQGIGLEGQILDIDTPNVVGEYDLKHMAKARQGSPTWRNAFLSPTEGYEKSDLFLTYAAPTRVSQAEFTVDHLRKVCGFAQGTNALSGDNNTARAVQLGCHVGWDPGPTGPWEVIMNSTPGTCIHQADAMVTAMGLLGVAASRELVVFRRTCPTDGAEVHCYWMKPNHSGPWNLHAICNVGSLSYSVSQPNTPFGSNADMWKTDGTGLVIDSFEKWRWDVPPPMPECTVQ